MKANRGDIEGMALIARQEAAQLGAPIYLVPTHNGYARETTQPRAKHLRVEPNGEVWQVPERTRYPVPGSVTEPRLMVAVS
jgi:hypothetical protein